MITALLLTGVLSQQEASQEQQSGGMIFRQLLQRESERKAKERARLARAIAADAVDRTLDSQFADFASARVSANVNASILAYYVRARRL